MVRVFFNQKGGVGKSSITCNLAAVSAQQGHRTLVIDLDSQCNSTCYLGLNEVLQPENEEVVTIADLLKQSIGWCRKPKPPIDFVYETEFENLFILPSSTKLPEIERELEARYKIYKLRDAIEELSKDFDNIFIDTPPNLNFFTKSALIAANILYIPFDCDSFSQQALYSVLDNAMELKGDHNKALEIGGIIINQFNSQTNLHSQIVNDLVSDDLPVIEQYLSSSVKMKESHQLQVPLVYMDAKHKLSQQFVELFNQLTATTVAD